MLGSSHRRRSLTCGIPSNRFSPSRIDHRRRGRTGHISGRNPSVPGRRHRTRSIPGRGIRRRHSVRGSVGNRTSARLRPVQFRKNSDIIVVPARLWRWRKRRITHVLILPPQHNIRTCRNHRRAGQTGLCRKPAANQEPRYSRIPGYTRSAPPCGWHSGALPGISVTRDARPQAPEPSRPSEPQALSSLRPPRSVWPPWSSRKSSGLKSSPSFRSPKSMLEKSTSSRPPSPSSPPFSSPKPKFG